MKDSEPVESAAAPFEMSVRSMYCRRRLRSQPRWVILQTGYRARDGSVYGYGTLHAGPTRKLVAVCRSEAGANRWLRRLGRWAGERAEHFDDSKLIPTYETIKAAELAGLAGPEPALCVGTEYYGHHGPKASLRAIILGVRESHTVLRQELRRRRSPVDRT